LTKKKVCNVDKGSYVLLLSCLSVDATVIHNVFVFIAFFYNPTWTWLNLTSSYLGEMRPLYENLFLAGSYDANSREITGY